MMAKGLHGFRMTSACLLVGLGLAVSASGQTAYLVEDLTPGVLDGEASSPSSLVAAGNRLFFVTSPNLGGENLLGAETAGFWTTNGTAAGTRQIPDGCSPACLGPPGFVGVAGNLTFFVTEDGLPQLWRSDGTVAGTFVLVERFGGPANARVAVLNDTLYFIELSGGTESAPSEQLWRSDGTVAGTTVVADVGPGLTIDQIALVAGAGKLFFVGPETGQGFYSEIWVSDGTAHGTAPLTTFDLTIVSAPTAVGRSVLFFTSPNGGQSVQLWATNGSHADTSLLATFTTAFELKAEGASLYFAANDGTHGGQIWVSDGTAAGTRQLTSGPSNFAVSGLEVAGSNLVLLGSMAQGATSLWGISPGSGGSLVPLCPKGCGTLGPDSVLLKSGSRVVFASGDGFDDGYAIWATDGTARGTVRLQLTCGAVCEDPPALTAVGAALYFRVPVPGSDLDELWRTDGTPAGTRRFAGPLMVDPNNWAAPAGFGSQVYFTAATGSNSGTELWVSDGTPAGTRQLTDARYPFSAFPTSLTAVGDQVIFASAPFTTGPALWRSGGTAATTLPMPGSQAYGGSPVLAAFGGVVFVGSDSQLWRSDGTAAGTQVLTAFSSPLAVSAKVPPVALGGQVFFLVLAQDGTSPWLSGSIWKSDGTPMGTTQAFALPAMVQDIESLAPAGGDLYFVLDNAQGGSDVWKSDGTASGTTQLTDFGAGSLIAADEGFVQLGSTVYFVVGGDGILWQTDGTTAGTSPAPLADLFAVDDLVASGGALYFFALSSTSSLPFSLWRSDGTPGGTSMLQTFPTSGVDIPPARGLTPFAGGLAFYANDGVHGSELWLTGGTPASTGMVRDIQPGDVGSHPHELTAVGGRLFFTADDGVHGDELWMSDGTAAGTRLVQDINPGLQASNPSGMTAAGSLLFFAANDGLTGVQLWALPLTGPGACQPSATTLCLINGRFKVAAFWQDFQGASGAGQAAALSGDTGTFWFFTPDSVELIVKMLDGRALNGSFWVFYGALSNVQYWLTITDTQTGVARRYLNPLGALASVGDTSAFGPMGATSTGVPAAAAAPALQPPQAVRSARAAALVPEMARAVPHEAEAAAAPVLRDAQSACQAGPSELCLSGGRFALTARWQDFSGNTGTGSAVPLTDETGYFWFFDASNVETVIKVIDGRGLNGHFWVFYGALSDVQYTLTVTDTVTGNVKTYTNPAGQFASVADTTAF